MVTKIKLLTSSNDANVVMGCLFGMGLTDLTFQMRESKPSDRMRAALDELVKKEAIVVETINMAGGLRYKCRIDAKPYARWYNKLSKEEKLTLTFNITQSIY